MPAIVFLCNKNFFASTYTNRRFFFRGATDCVVWYRLRNVFLRVEKELVEFQLRD